VLDRPESPLETTLAVMTTTAIDRARQSGVLEGHSYQSMRDRSQAAVLAHVSASGALGLVSDATPIGELRMYVTRPFGVFPWGQGPLLLMLAGPSPSTSEPEKTR
jgi:unsaturated rhamnogalacturonyl hydrolase